MGNIHPKVQAAGLGGLATSLVMGGLSLLHVDLPPEVAAAIATIVAFACGYIKVGDLPVPVQDVLDVVEEVEGARGSSSGPTGDATP